MADEYRSMDMNKVELAGNLTRDPELKYIASGDAVCGFSVAVTKRYKDKKGNKKESTVFVDCTAWRKLAEFIGERVEKGNPVFVEGSLVMDEWEDKQTGQKRTKLKVNVFRLQPLTWTNQNSSGGGRSADRGTAAPPGGRQPRPIEEPIPEDDIPF